MISFLGIFAAIIFLASASALILHNKVLTRRGAVDDTLAALDAVLRERLDIIYENAVLQNAGEICALCESFFALETRRLLEAFGQIKMENAEVLAEIYAETDKAIAEFNAAVTEFNAYIAKFPANAMAFILGLGKENTIV